MGRHSSRGSRPGIGGYGLRVHDIEDTMAM